MKQKHICEWKEIVPLHVQPNTWVQQQTMWTVLFMDTVC